ncbi:hypothetical protein C121_21 [Stenotrophomonas phage C121]|uniref:hypothetical protein n=1 Tax=Stenotrophomonas phage C121 TaxID=2914029 RepID=UPI00232918CB|nr:hypothetical protein PP752_gp21 [Stenotrophomonas phage C121]UKL14754.1 hypothetical protein C121_21 [Stenotrophomonas phage C121]
MKRIIRVNKLFLSYNSTPQRVEAYYSKPFLRGNLYITDAITELSFKNNQLIRVETEYEIYVLVKE